MCVCVCVCVLFCFNDIHQRPINFERFLYGCLVRLAAFIYTYFSKECVCLNVEKSVNFHFVEYIWVNYVVELMFMKCI